MNSSPLPTAVPIPLLLTGLQAGGVPLSDGLVCAYEIGSNTPKTLWRKSDKSALWDGASHNQAKLDARADSPSKRFPDGQPPSTYLP